MDDILIVNCNIIINIEKNSNDNNITNLLIICITLLQFTTQNNKNIKRFDFYFLNRQKDKQNSHYHSFTSLNN
jgi:hypothetical protein